MAQKIIEVRDAGTHVDVLAIRLEAQNEQERYILARSGYGGGNEDFANFTLMIDLNWPVSIWGSAYECEMDTRPSRTFYEAHRELTKNWDAYKSGDVLDVQFVIGETDHPKKSDRFYDPYEKEVM